MSERAAHVTPLVRKLASDNNVDLTLIKATDGSAQIRKQDVLNAVAVANSPAPAVVGDRARAGAPGPVTLTEGSGVSTKRGTTKKMSRLRKVIAARMVESLHVSAQLTTVVEVDVTKIARLRERAKGDFETREGTKLSFLPFLALAAIEALQAHPSVNSSLDGDQITYHGFENLGARDQQRRRPQHRRPGPQDRRPGRADPHEHDLPR
jgi:pyruvate dehydrogenase E2 component (dihydrolipoamide acetyltransferase)